MTGVYKITSPTGRIYIGSTNDFDRRISEYKYLGCKDQIRLYNSLRKYGYDNHTIEFIEECTLDNLFDRERFWQERYNVLDKYKGLNCEYVKTNNKPKVVSKCTREKLSRATRGVNNPRYGKKLSLDTKKKISEGNKGRRQSEELNKQQAERMLGNTFSKLSKKLVDTETGVVYDSINKASIALGINYSTLKACLRGRLKNKTTLKFL